MNDLNSRGFLPENGDEHREIENLPSNYTEIVVIRHGETDWNADGRIQGHLDVDLNDVGRQQAAAVADWLSKESKVSAIYSSDLRRASDTAEIIAKNCGVLEVVKDPDLRPDSHKAILSNQSDQEIPGGGESPDQLYKRCSSVLQKIAGKHRGERVVVVTHGGTIKALHMRASSDGRSAGTVLNASVNVFHLSYKDEWSIKSWGEVSHLDQIGYLDSGFGGDNVRVVYTYHP